MIFIPTGKPYWEKECANCAGIGRVPYEKAELEGWYIVYHYQDGHEQSGPYTKKEVMDKVMQASDHYGYNFTLVGPDGMIYKYEMESKDKKKRKK